MFRPIATMLAALIALLAAPLAAQPEFPELTGRVVDDADIISPATEEQLTAQLEALETQSQRQLVVVTLPDLQGYDIADYGYQLGREWGLGDETRNDGALLIVAPNERKVRIEVGYGLEGRLTDAYASTIIQNDIVPSFRSGDMEGGIVAGTAAIANHLLLPEAEAAQLMIQRVPETLTTSNSEPWWVLPLLLFVPFMFVLVPVVIGASGSSGRTRYGSTSSGTSVSTYSSSGSSWSSSSSSSSFSSGSSFSGGGGSFGGGGASGSW